MLGNDARRVYVSFGIRRVSRTHTSTLKPLGSDLACFDAEPPSSSSPFDCVTLLSVLFLGGISEEDRQEKLDADADARSKTLCEIYLRWVWRRASLEPGCWEREIHECYR